MYSGLSAFIITTHPGMLAITALVAMGVSAVFYFFLAQKRPLSVSICMTMLFFLGSWASLHVFASAISGNAPIEVEVIRL